MTVISTHFRIAPISRILKISMASLAFAIVIGIAALVRIPLPGTPIPATLQTFALLTGAGILTRFGALQMVFWYLILGLIGAPFFAGGSGLTHLFGASGGYLIGFALASIVVGFLDKRDTIWYKRLTIYFIATIIIYPPGLIHLKYITGANWGVVFTIGLIPFIIFDIIKAITACACVKLVRRVV